MAIDTLLVYAEVYDSVRAAEADCEVVKDLATGAGLIDGYDAAVTERPPDGNTKIVSKHETPIRAGRLLGRADADWPRGSSWRSLRPQRSAPDRGRPQREPERGRLG